MPTPLFSQQHFPVEADGKRRVTPWTVGHCVELLPIARGSEETTDGVGAQNERLCMVPTSRCSPLAINGTEAIPMNELLEKYISLLSQLHEGPTLPHWLSAICPLQVPHVRKWSGTAPHRSPVATLIRPTRTPATLNPGRERRPRPST